MTDRITNHSDLAGEAFRAASKRMAGAGRSGVETGIQGSLGDTFRERAAEMLARNAPATQRVTAPERSSQSLGSILNNGLDAVAGELRGADRLPEAIVMGEVGGPAEVAARIKRADLTLKYSLEIRNRLVDAYREVMRMSV